MSLISKLLACAALTLCIARGEYVLNIDKKARLADGALIEASGMAASRTSKGCYWAINDSGCAPQLFLMKANGKALGKVTVENAKNIDWEDLASFTHQGKPYLLIADTGDNAQNRPFCLLHIIREPTERDARKGRNAKPEWSIRIRYPGGPRDCEAVAVDTTQDKIILVSKRTTPPEVYELPLRPAKLRNIITLTKIGTTEVKAPESSLVAFRDQPTALDISADGKMAAICTYYGVFLFSKEKPGQTWANAFSNGPSWQKTHGLAQAESVAFSAKSKHLYATSEGQHAPIVRYSR